MTEVSTAEINARIAHIRLVYGDADQDAALLEALLKERQALDFLRSQVAALADHCQPRYEVQGGAITRKLRDIIESKPAATAIELAYREGVFTQAELSWPQPDEQEWWPGQTLPVTQGGGEEPATKPAPAGQQPDLVTAAKALASWCLRSLPRSDELDGLLHGLDAAISAAKLDAALAACQPSQTDAELINALTDAEAKIKWLERAVEVIGKANEQIATAALHHFDRAEKLAASQSAPEPWAWHLRDLTAPPDKLGILVRERDRLAIAQPPEEWEVTPLYAAPQPLTVQDAARDAELLLSAYKGLLVLHRMMVKAGLHAGEKTTSELADRIVSAHPEFPALAALRAIAEGRA